MRLLFIALMLRAAPHIANDAAMAGIGIAPHGLDGRVLCDEVEGFFEVLSFLGRKASRKRARRRIHEFSSLVGVRHARASVFTKTRDTDGPHCVFTDTDP